MNIGIIGSGLQCQRRLESLKDSNEDRVILVVGNNSNSLDSIAKKYSVSVSNNTDLVFSNYEIETVLICTPPSSHFEYMRKALESGKKVLVEKPISKSSNEIVDLINMFGSKVESDLRCGFNHRFHPAMQMAKTYINENRIGEVLYARSTYGISARPAYTEEWRSNPDLAAGGQFIEQGSHQIDLLQWLIGPVKSIYCKTTNNIFENQPLDDGGMAILTFSEGVTAQIHTTLAQWHNRFELEIYGKKGFLRVNGLGNTYGTETFEYGERDDFAPFNSHIHQFRGLDKSWILEWQAFKESMNGKVTDIGTVDQALKVMSIAEAAYLSDKVHKEIFL